MTRQIPSGGRISRTLFPAFALLSLVVGQARGLGFPQPSLYFPRASCARAPQAQQTVLIPFHGVLPLLRAIDSGLERDLQILARMTELAEQATSGTQNSSDRVILNAKYQSNVGRIDFVAETTTYRDHRVMNGSTNFVLQGPYQPPNETPLILPGFLSEDLGLRASTSNLTTVTNAFAALNMLDDAFDTLQQARVNLRLTFAQVLLG